MRKILSVGEFIYSRFISGRFISKVTCFVLSSFFVFAHLAYASEGNVMYGNINSIPIEINYRQINLTDNSKISAIYVPDNSASSLSQNYPCDPSLSWSYYVKNKWYTGGGYLSDFIDALNHVPVSSVPNSIYCYRGFFMSRNYTWIAKVTEEPEVSYNSLLEDKYNGHIFIGGGPPNSGDLKGSYNESLKIPTYYTDSIFIKNGDYRSQYPVSYFPLYSSFNGKGTYYKVSGSKTLGKIMFYYKYSNSKTPIPIASVDLSYDGSLYYYREGPSVSPPIISGFNIKVNSIQGGNLKVFAIKKLATTSTYSFIKDPANLIKINIMLACTQPDTDQAEPCVDGNAPGGTCYIPCDPKNIPAK